MRLRPGRVGLEVLRAVSASPRGFDRLSRAYRALEFLAFGRDLERARFSLLGSLADRRDILVLGEGDGRCLERLRALAPQANIHCVDASRAMLDRARARLGEAGGGAGGSRGGPGGRVTLEHADAFEVRLEPGRHDAVVTLFFLDCFTTGRVSVLMDRIQASLAPGALWLFADFALPARGWRRWRARAWLALLYACFRWETGIEARALPESERLMSAAGWRPRAVREFQAGLVRTVLLRRAH